MLYLIRHGEPSAGFGAHPDPGLSPLGERQAEKAAEILAELGANRAISSPLARCRGTARPFEKRLETHARIDPRVGEIITPAGIEDRPTWLRGVMMGTWAEAPAQYGKWRTDVMAALDGLPAGTAVFSHFVAINVIVGTLTGDGRVTVFRPGHASITKIEKRDGRLQIVELGQEGALVAM